MADKKELAKVEAGTLTFDDEKVQLIKNTVAKDATDSELQLFLHQAARTGLDPLSRQIYFMKSKTPDQYGERKVTIQTSIDGFRVVAERSGDYAGQDEPEFIEENGKLVCAKVKVYKWRDGVRYQASTGVAYWAEYAGDKPTYMWNKMPHTMLAKVAEALALRKAFPQDLSGLYSSEEMEQANVEVVEAKVADAPRAQDWQIAEIIRLGGELGNTEENTSRIAARKWGRASIEDLTDKEASATIDSINARLEEVTKLKSKAFDEEPVSGEIVEKKN